MPRNRAQQTLQNTSTQRVRQRYAASTRLAQRPRSENEQERELTRRLRDITRRIRGRSLSESSDTDTQAPTPLPLNPQDSGPSQPARHQQLFSTSPPTSPIPPVMPIDLTMHMDVSPPQVSNADMMPADRGYVGVRNRGRHSVSVMERQICGGMTRYVEGVLFEHAFNTTEEDFACLLRNWIEVSQRYGFQDTPSIEAERHVSPQVFWYNSGSLPVNSLGL